ncbi:MAG: hypothetical protein K9L68_15020, partial [Spirochaetales bacterium]|nr:hypothetical protein [Spirochaetales bacterium]
LIQIGYQGANQYQSNSLAELIDNKTIRTIASIDFGTHRYFCFVDRNNDLYAMTNSQSSGVSAWTKLMSGVGWIHAIGQDLYAAVNRSGSYYLEIIPFDNIQNPGGRDENLTEMFWELNRYGDKGGFIYAWDDLSGEHITQDTLPPSATVDVYELPGNTYIGAWTTDADGLLTKSATQVLTDTGHTAEGDEVHLWAYESGVYPTATLKTLPLYIPVQSGLEWEQPRRINKVILKVIDSMAAKVRIGEGEWEEWSQDTEYSGTKEFYVDGNYSDEVQVEIQAIEDKPLHITSIEAEVSTGE